MTKKKSEVKEKLIKVTQIASPIGKESSQRKTLIGLGLNKIGRSKYLPENLSIEGMINKVRHLLKIERA